jgi:hypothetical protein
VGLSCDYVGTTFGGVGLRSAECGPVPLQSSLQTIFECRSCRLMVESAPVAPADGIWPFGKDESAAFDGAERQCAGTRRAMVAWAAGGPSSAGRPPDVDQIATTGPSCPSVPSPLARPQGSWPGPELPECAHSAAERPRLGGSGAGLLGFARADGDGVRAVPEPERGVLDRVTAVLAGRRGFDGTEPPDILGGSRAAVAPRRSGSVGRVRLPGDGGRSIGTRLLTALVRGPLVITT